MIPDINVEIKKEGFSKENFLDFTLAGDIGGSNCNLGVFGLTEDRDIVLLFYFSYKSHLVKDFPAAVNDVLRYADEQFGVRIVTSVFGCAGPVSPDKSRVELTNVGLVIDEKELKQRTLLSNMILLNDMEAAAFGLSYVRDYSLDSLSEIKEGAALESGNVAIVSPGTGLGACILFYNKEKRNYIPMASEAGQMDLSPVTDMQRKLFDYLKEKVTGGKPPSYEVVVSGMGISNIYNFLKDTEKLSHSDDLAQQISSAEDKIKPKIITANMENDELCKETVSLFIEVLAQFCRNVSLFTLCRGGLYLGGGILPQLEERLSDGQFVKIFQDQPIFPDLLRRIPVNLIKDYAVSIIGAAFLGLSLNDRFYGD